MMRYVYPASLTPDEEDGGFVVTFPDVPEGVTQGDDRDEALREVQDAVRKLVHPDHASKIEKVQKAMEALGKRLIVEAA